MGTGMMRMITLSTRVNITKDNSIDVDCIISMVAAIRK